MSNSARLATVAVTYYNLAEFFPATWPPSPSKPIRIWKSWSWMTARPAPLPPASSRSSRGAIRSFDSWPGERRSQPGAGNRAWRKLAANSSSPSMPIISALDMVEHSSRACSATACSALTCHVAAFRKVEDIDVGRFEFLFMPMGGPHIAACFNNVYGDTNAVFRTADLRTGRQARDRRRHAVRRLGDVRQAGPRGYAIDVIPEPLFYYRFRGDNRSFVMTKSYTETFPYVQRIVKKFFVPGTAAQPESAAPGTTSQASTRRTRAPPSGTPNQSVAQPHRNALACPGPVQRTTHSHRTVVAQPRIDAIPGRRPLRPCSAQGAGRPSPAAPHVARGIARLESRIPHPLGEFSGVALIHFSISSLRFHLQERIIFEGRFRSTSLSDLFGFITTCANSAADCSTAFAVIDPPRREFGEGGKRKRLFPQDVNGKRSSPQRLIFHRVALLLLVAVVSRHLPFFGTGFSTLSAHFFDIVASLCRAQHRLQVVAGTRRRPRRELRQRRRQLCAVRSTMQDQLSNFQQQRKCREKAEQNLHAIDSELEFADEAVSGTKRDRDGLNTMLALFVHTDSEFSISIACPAWLASL